MAIRDKFFQASDHLAYTAIQLRANGGMHYTAASDPDLKIGNPDADMAVGIGAAPNPFKLGL